MKIGDLVRSRLDKDEAKLGIVIEFIDLFVEDVECNMWDDYPQFIKVVFSQGRVEVNPTELYEVVCSFNQLGL